MTTVRMADGTTLTVNVDGKTEDNLFIWVGDEPIGSLFFERDAEGALRVSLGAVDPSTDMWEYAAEHSQADALGRIPARDAREDA